MTPSDPIKATTPDSVKVAEIAHEITNQLKFMPKVKVLIEQRIVTALTTFGNSRWDEGVEASAKVAEQPILNPGMNSSEIRGYFVASKLIAAAIRQLKQPKGEG